MHLFIRKIYFFQPQNLSHLISSYYTKNKILQIQKNTVTYSLITFKVNLVFYY